MTKILFCFTLLLLPVLVRGEDVVIRIFTRTKPSAIVFTPSSDGYILFATETDTFHIKANEPVIISRYNDRVAFRTASGRSGIADSISLRTESAGHFSLRVPGSDKDFKTLDGTLGVKSFPGSLLILNKTELENYLPGVVRAEAGSRGPAEYFRTQAVVARTYACRHAERHSLDGYNLCDDTHCQVYPGMIAEKAILDACRYTEGKVIVDKDSILIISAFHANCGGVTASSQDVWVASAPYLVSVRDPYCVSSNNARWEKSIPVTRWRSFLSTKGIVSSGEITTENPVVQSRSLFYLTGDRRIPREDIRNEFGLKSSFFVVTATNENIIFRGRGYGHGVGLCQDGARNMASAGKKHQEIILFYYPGTTIVDKKIARLPLRP